MARTDEGFTLVELLIALVLFGLISVAGLALVDSVLGVQGRTAGRLDRLADVQRAMLLVTTDIEQIAAANLSGDSARVSFTRAAPGIGGPAVPVTYALAGGTLMRVVGGRPQALLTGVATARWRYYDADWSVRWPPTPETAESWPRAVELQLTLAGGTPAGVLRRVILLPVRAREPAT